MIRSLPDQAAISAITSAELTAGSLLASDPSEPAGRKPRKRFVDLLIAATADANGFDPYTRNPDDFAGLEDLIHVVAV